jgi:hypothetical protein
MMVVYRHRTDTGCVVLLPDRWHKPPSVRTADQPGWYEFAAPDLLDCIASIMDLDEMCGERTGKNVISKNAWRFLVTTVSPGRSGTGICAAVGQAAQLARGAVPHSIGRMAAGQQWGRGMTREETAPRRPPIYSRKDRNVFQ